MWCRLGLKWFSWKPAGFVSAAGDTMGIGWRSGSTLMNRTGSEFLMLEMERDLSSSKVSKVDNPEQCPFSI
jgi:hypothetical protein